MYIVLLIDIKSLVNAGKIDKYSPVQFDISDRRMYAWCSPFVPPVAPEGQNVK